MLRHAFLISTGSLTLAPVSTSVIRLQDLSGEIVNLILRRMDGNILALNCSCMPAFALLGLTWFLQIHCH